MIRVAISEAAFDAIAKTFAPGFVNYETAREQAALVHARRRRRDRDRQA
jgi:hypothetical protein